MEFKGSVFGGLHIDVSSEEGIQAPLDCRARHIRAGEEIADLVYGMDPCSGSARGDEFNGLANHHLDFFFDNLLDCQPVLLSLPSVISAPVVGEGESDVLIIHGEPKKGESNLNSPMSALTENGKRRISVLNIESGLWLPAGRIFSVPSFLRPSSGNPVS